MMYILAFIGGVAALGLFGLGFAWFQVKDKLCGP